MTLSKSASSLQNQDPEVYSLFGSEAQRLQHGIELIASENVASAAVLSALSNVFSNKYAEGYPGKRYYGGCEYADALESLAITRVLRIFGADHANVQPHSGAQANQAVFLAALKAGDTILGMDLSHGGHLTHGSKVSTSGIFYNSEFYGVNESTGFIDYEIVRQKALQCRPKLIIAGASAYARTLDFEAFHNIAQEVGALLLVDMAHIAGLVAAGLHPSPVPYADFVTSTTHKTLRGPRGGFILCKHDWAKAIDKAVFPGLQGGPLMHVIGAKAVAFGEALQPSFQQYIQQVVINARILAAQLLEAGFQLVSNGTDNHLILLDLRQSVWSGKDAEGRLAQVGITVNKNTVPGETRKPMVTSGIRIGTPAVTTRGFKAVEMNKLAKAIELSLRNDDSEFATAREIVKELCEQFPLYQGSQLSYQGFESGSHGGLFS